MMVMDAGLAAWDHVPRALAAAWYEGGEGKMREVVCQEEKLCNDALGILR